MKQQTAVEYMYNIMFEKEGRISKEEFEKAKVMFEEQIKDAYENGLYDGDGRNTSHYNMNSEQYYNETFK